MARHPIRLGSAALVAVGAAAAVVLSSSPASAFSPLSGLRCHGRVLASGVGSDGGTPSALAMAGRRNNRYQRRGPVVAEKPPMNEEITASEIRVTVPNPSGGKDEALGVMSREDALAKAKEMGGLDLILVNANSDPPVCKIAEYSKYRYMQERKAKESKKNSKATEIKEVKMSYKIDVHDYEVRKKNALKFLNQGNRVKCTVTFRGREIQHDKLGFELLEDLVKDMEDVCTREGRPKREGRNLSLIISPRPDVMKRVNENRRAGEKAKKNKKKEKMARRAAEKEASTASDEQKAAVNGEGAASAVSANGAGDALDDNEEDDDDVVGSIESSLDELFGTDDLKDDLFG